MSTTPHLIAPEEVMAFLDGQLPADRAQSISAHLDECAECREAGAALRTTSQSLSNWTVPAAPSNVAFEDRLRAAVAKNPSPAETFGSSIFRRANLWTWKQWVSGLVLTGATILLVFSIAVPNLLRSRMAANEAAAIGRQRAEQQMAAGQGTLGKFESFKSPVADSVAGQPAPESESWSIRRLPLLGKDKNSSAGAMLGRVQQETKQQATYHGWLQSAPMIARTVSLAIVAKDFTSARASLDTILARHNGYSANLSVSTSEGAARALQASLRIPAPQLSAALAELKSLGHVENENQAGEEVTQQHADLVARLKNSRETEQRLQAILIQRTGKISDVLEVEQEIARVRGEIEQMEAEQQTLEHRVDFATIDLRLAEEYKAQLGSPAAISVSTRLHNALVNGYRSAADSLLALVLFFAEYGPVLLVWFAILAMPAWLIWRRWRRNLATI